MLVIKGVVVFIVVVMSMFCCRVLIFVLFFDVMFCLFMLMMLVLKNDVMILVVVFVDLFILIWICEKNFYRLYTIDEDEELKWECKSSNYVYMLCLIEVEIGFNNDGIIKVLDVFCVVGFNLFE